MDPIQTRRALSDRAFALLAREERITVHLRGADGRRELDPADAATLLANDEVLEGLEDRALEELREIRAALARLDEGRYGLCESCGGPIAAERLAVLPQARRCVSCS